MNESDPFARDPKDERNIETVVGINPLTGEADSGPVKPPSSTPPPTPAPGSPTVAAPSGGMPPPLFDRPPSIADLVLEKQLGKGGMGAVWKGRQVTLDRAVAVKVIHPDLAQDPSFVQRFDREAKVLARLQHPNIVTCYQAGTAQTGERYLLMEFVEGEDLLRTVKSRGPLGERDALVIARQIAQGLDHALEAGIIHRDVKPENILLKGVPMRGAETTIGVQAKIVDLGLAAMARPDEKAVQITTAGTALGTPVTMAPEQAEAPETVDHRADIYAIGCTLYFALTGRFPHEGATIAAVLSKKLRGEMKPAHEHRPQVTPETSALIQKLMALAPGDRPASYDDVLALLDAAIARFPGPQARATSSHLPVAKEAPPEPAASGGARIALFVLVPAAAILAAVTAIHMAQHEEPGATSPVIATPASATVTAPPPPPPPPPSNANEPERPAWDAPKHVFGHDDEVLAAFVLEPPNIRWQEGGGDRGVVDVPLEFGRPEESTAYLKDAPPRDGFRFLGLVYTNRGVLETGARVALEDGSRLDVALQPIGDTLIFKIARRNAEGKAVATETLPFSDAKDRRQLEVIFVKGKLWARVDGSKWLGMSAGSPSKRLGLYARASKGAGSFGDFVLETARW